MSYRMAGSLTLSYFYIAYCELINGMTYITCGHAINKFTLCNYYSAKFYSKKY